MKLLLFSFFSISKFSAMWLHCFYTKRIPKLKANNKIKSSQASWNPNQDPDYCCEHWASRCPERDPCLPFTSLVAALVTSLRPEYHSNTKTNKLTCGQVRTFEASSCHACFFLNSLRARLPSLSCSYCSEMPHLGCHLLLTTPSILLWSLDPLFQCWLPYIFNLFRPLSQEEDLALSWLPSVASKPLMIPTLVKFILPEPHVVPQSHF